MNADEKLEAIEAVVYSEHSPALVVLEIMAILEPSAVSESLRSTLAPHRPSAS